MARGCIAYDQIRDADRRGNGPKIQMSDGTGASGHLAAFDANGNLTDGGAPSASQPYDVVCSLIGKPDAGGTVLLITFVRDVSFPADFSGSRGSCGANPTSAAVYTVKKNSSSIGTVSISSLGSFTFSTGGLAQSFSAGDVLSVTAPSPQDATLSDVAITFGGTR